MFNFAGGQYITSESEAFNQKSPQSDDEKYDKVRKFIKQPKTSLRTIIGKKPPIDNLKMQTIQKLSKMYLHTMTPSFENN